MSRSLARSLIGLVMFDLFWSSVPLYRFLPNRIIPWSEVARVPTGSLFVRIWLRTFLWNFWLMSVLSGFNFPLFGFLSLWFWHFCLCLKADVERRNLLHPLHHTVCPFPFLFNDWFLFRIGSFPMFTSSTLCLIIASFLILLTAWRRFFGDKASISLTSWWPLSACDLKWCI